MNKQTKSNQTFNIEKLYQELKTHSSVFRYLHSQNLNYYQISKLTGKRPQHVRNVLITPIKKK